MGGASNSGGKALLRFFTAGRMAELAPRLRPDRPTGLHWHPLPEPRRAVPGGRPGPGVRARPLPEDEVVLFQGLLEGIAEVEAARLRACSRELGAPPLRSVRTVGGGAANLGLDGDARRGSWACRCCRRRTWRPATAPRCWREGRCAEAGGLAELAAFSAEIGRDPEQVQAAGGNTSLKEAGVLWVKASGLWLADALERDIFVPVRARSRFCDGIAADAADPVSGAVMAALNPEGLRPSIETTLHALLPHRIVVHTHSVRTIALAIRSGRRGARLPSGWPAALGLGALLQARPAADPAVAERWRAGRRTCSSWATTAWSSARVGSRGTGAAGRGRAPPGRARRRRARRQPQAPRRRTAATRLPEHPLVHTLAVEPKRLQLGAAGSLYPDHVIFLGPAARSSRLGRSGRAGTSKLLFGRVLARCSPRAPAQAPTSWPCAWPWCWSGCRRTATLRYLTAADEAELINWDAEKYRQALARSHGH